MTFSNNKPIIALTGATGFLGSHLMDSFLAAGYKLIILGRRNKEETLEKRILQLLGWFGKKHLSDQMEMFEVDYNKPRLGLSEPDYKRVCTIDQIVHCASDTCFSENKREEVLQFNVHQLQGILDFASDAHIDFFHYISTAYAAGINGEICEEKLTTAKKFTNIYEESKALAEKRIAAFCEKNYIPFTIIRPSVVYGDSLTGRTLKFNAFYYPIRSVLTIRDIYLNDIKHHGGKRAAKQGIFIDKNGFMFLPLKVSLPGKGGINLIPVDYFVRAAQRIIENPVPGAIFNLTNNNSADLETMAIYNEKLLKVRGVEIIYGDANGKIPGNAVEELFDRFIGPYRPYLSDIRVFDRRNTNRITGDIHPPPMTNKIFRRCIKYAVKVNWGENIFKKKL